MSRPARVKPFDYWEHPFAKLVFEEQRAAAVASIREVGIFPPKGVPFSDWQAANRRTLSEQDVYKRFVCSKLLNLANALEHSNRAMRLLLSSPGKFGRGTTPINRLDWAYYHFMSFAGSIGTINDCCILLVAAVYRLGMTSKHCKLDAVTSNAWVEGSPAARSLQALNKAVQPHRPHRNRAAHQGEVELGEFLEFDAETDSLFKIVLRVSTDTPDVFGREKSAEVWKTVVRDLRPKARETQQSVTACVRQVLDSLEAPYQARVSSLAVMERLKGSSPS